MTNYQAKEFSLSKLQGISDQTLETHFKLYQGYVKETNHLNEVLQDLIKKAEDSKALSTNPSYSETKRRLGFEYNGMVLHEYYFDNLTSSPQSNPSNNSAFSSAVSQTFGNFESWKKDFVATGSLRGVGWAAAVQDQKTGAISNHWVELHETGNIAGFKPILIMDVWEHAFLLDYKPAERGKYIESFFANINWSKVEERLNQK